jgi:nitroimidazol reductase NimA-like FMN-containing flavoprotein (pyridoxamine 5'-phosphate oxidase superfamily)
MNKERKQPRIGRIGRIKTMKKKNDPTFNPVRREGKAVEDPAWIREMLHKGAFGVLATSQAGQPYAKPILFVYDEEQEAVYLHGAHQGRTREALQANPQVCFCVSEMGRLLPANTAMEFGVEYSSVIIFGQVSSIDSNEEAGRALQMLLDKYFPHLHPGDDYRAITPEELRQTAVTRLEIESWSGKRAQAPAGFPGAFFYPHS